jgi:hypothetical protein
MCAVSTRMAFLHRRFYLTARNAFLGTGASSMFLGFYFLRTRAAAAAAGFYGVCGTCTRTLLPTKKAS